MSTQENTVLRIFRIIGDRRIPYHFELDPTMTVVVDRPDLSMLKSQIAERMSPSASDTPPVVDQEINLQPGVEVLETKVMPDGSKHVVIKPSSSDITLGAWVTRLVADNPIPGTDDLRAEYFEAEAAMKAKHESDGTVCKPCETGALMRKYRAKLESLGHLK